MNNYRGKRKDSGETIVGDLVTWAGVKYIIPDHIPISDVPVEAIGTKASCIGYAAKEAHPESLAQSTGMKDKNKKPIYGSIPVDGVMSKGGDMVDWCPAEYHWEDYCDDLDEFEEGQVCWHAEAGRWAIEIRGQMYWPTDCEFFAVEVIGNAYDNPELLGGE